MGTFSTTIFAGILSSSLKGMNIFFVNDVAEKRKWIDSKSPVTECRRGSRCCVFVQLCTFLCYLVRDPAQCFAGEGKGFDISMPER